MSARSGKRKIEDQDELEYNITFPTTTEVNEDELKEPVVYLLGWATASDKHLAKYSSIYEKEGCITIRYIHPEDEIFLMSSTTISTFKSTAEKLCQLLEDYDLEENPIVVHCFSNNGACVYRYMADIFPRKKICMVGAILDSAPSKLELQVGLKAIYFCQRPRGLLAFWTYLGRFLWHFSTFVASYGFQPLDFYEGIATSKSHLWPYLFLYSRNDGVIPPQHVLDACKARETAGSAFVRKRDFKDSPHVQHLKFHQVEYTEQCILFLDECLRRFDDGEMSGGVSGPRSSSVDPPTARPISDNRPSTSGSRRSSACVRSASQSDTII